MTEKGHSKEGLDVVNNIICPIFYLCFDRDWSGEWSAESLIERNVHFEKFLNCFYAVDVRIQQFLRSIGSNEDAKPYFSNNHKRYGFKSDASVMPKDLRISFFIHQRDGVSDITIFRELMTLHYKMLKSSDDDNNVDDTDGDC